MSQRLSMMSKALLVMSRIHNLLWNVLALVLGLQSIHAESVKTGA
jgi:hypothetical protein